MNKPQRDPESKLPPPNEYSYMFLVPRGPNAPPRKSGSGNVILCKPKRCASLTRARLADPNVQVGQCENCKEAIWVSTISRTVKKAQPSFRLLCETCAVNDIQHGDANGPPQDAN